MKIFFAFYSLLLGPRTNLCEKRFYDRFSLLSFVRFRRYTFHNFSNNFSKLQVTRRIHGRGEGEKSIGWRKSIQEGRGGWRKKKNGTVECSRPVIIVKDKRRPISEEFLELWKNNPPPWGILERSLLINERQVAGARNERGRFTPSSFTPRGPLSFSPSSLVSPPLPPPFKRFESTSFFQSTLKNARWKSLPRVCRFLFNPFASSVCVPCVGSDGAKSQKIQKFSEYDV